MIDKLFEPFGQYLEAKAILRGAGRWSMRRSCRCAAAQQPRRDRAGQDRHHPEDWKKRPSKNRQKDKDARWTKKHGRSLFGYKNHVNADARHKLIRDYG